MTEELFLKIIDMDGSPDVPTGGGFENDLRERSVPFFEALAALETALDAETQIRWSTSDRYQLWFAQERAKLQAAVEGVAEKFREVVLSLVPSCPNEARTAFLRAVKAYKEQRLMPGVLDADQVLLEAAFDLHRTTNDLLPFNRTGRLVREVVEDRGQGAVL